MKASLSSTAAARSVRNEALVAFAGGAVMIKIGTIEDARYAKEWLVGVIKAAPAIVGVGIMKMYPGGYALRINVADSLPPGARLPHAVQGVPADVRVVGSIRKMKKMKPPLTMAWLRALCPPPFSKEDDNYVADSVARRTARRTSRPIRAKRDKRQQ